MHDEVHQQNEELMLGGVDGDADLNDDEEDEATRFIERIMYVMTLANRLLKELFYYLLFTIKLCN